MPYAALAVLFTLMYAAPASVNCPASAPKLLWSYPADGATDVPTNLVFWALEADGAEPTRVTLDGVLMTKPGEYGGFDLGELHPSQEYRLEVGYRNDASASNVFVISFRTGATGITHPSSAAPYGESRTRGYEDSPCLEVIEAQGCFDQGQDTLITVHQMTFGDPLVAWNINGHLWPIECGEPAVYVSENEDERRCGWVFPIGIGGRTGGKSQYCDHRDLAEGCSTSSAKGGAFWLTLLTLAVARRRRPRGQTSL